MYVCVRDKLEQSVHAVKISDYIGTRILEVCECPESVAVRSNGFGRVLGGKNWIGIYIFGILQVSRKCRRPMHWL